MLNNRENGRLSNVKTRTEAIDEIKTLQKVKGEDMVAIIVVLLFVGGLGTYVLLLGTKSEEEQEFEDQCQTQYLTSFHQKTRRRRFHWWRQSRRGGR